MNLSGIINERLRKRNKKTKILSEQEKKENIIKWATFYRRNMNIYAERRLGIRLHPFQHIMIYLMSISQTFFAICTRGISKTFIVGLFAVCESMLYPYSEVVITATTIAQGAVMVKSKIENEIVKKLSPLLLYLYENNQIKFSYNDNEIKVEFLFNGSIIRVLPSGDQSRGYRATVLIYEECRLLKKNMVDSVFSPMSHPRQAKFITREKYAGDKRWQEETISIYITSARMKSEWFWTTFKEVVQKCYNSKRIVENFFAADIYTAIEYGLKTKADFEKSKSQMSELDFRMEILNEMIGEAENAFFTLEMFRNNQVLTVPFVPPNVRDILGGEDDYIKEKAINEYRLLFIDFAFANTTTNQENDNSILGCMSLFYKNKKIYRNVDYITTHPASDSPGMEKKIREFYWDYNADYIVMDLRNGGEVLYNNLTNLYEHPERGNSWNPHGFTVANEGEIHVVQDAKLSDLRSRSIDKEAIPAIVPIIGTSDLNSMMWMDLQLRLRNKEIRFLVDEMEYQQILEETSRYFKMTSEQRIIERLPYIQTLLLVNEAINLSPSWKDGKVKLSEPRSGMKDRIVACSYGNWIGTLLENKLSKEDNYGEMDISQYQLVF